jgi:hypothetical protein
MTRNQIAACFLSLAVTGIANAQSTAASADSGARYSQAQVKQLEITASTPSQYRVLAAYYGEQHKSYLQKAAEEQKEWERRSQNVMGVLAKYPRPVDSARNLYEYYMYKASATGALEAKYDKLAESDQPAHVQ